MVTLPDSAADPGFLGAFGQIWATVRVEIVMQWRRWGLWLAFAFATSLIVLIFVGNRGTLTHLPANSVYVRLHFTRRDFANLFTFATTDYGDLLFGIVAALLVADRIGWDRHLGMFELQRATPQGYARYILGKFLGNYLAVLVPTLLGYLFCALALILLGMPVVVLQTSSLGFVLVFVPAFTAIVGLTLCLASFLPVRIVQIGFPLLWLYANESPLGWHTLNDTIFNPNGRYFYPIFFPAPITQLYAFETSFPLKVLNITVLVLTAMVALFLTYGSLTFQQYREEGAYDAKQR